jgi:hypothetical protein
VPRGRAGRRSGRCPLFEETYSPIVAALGKVLAAAGQAGVVRAGLDPDDVILALAGLWEIDPATDWKARARTLYDLVFTGLKADPPADQSTSPLVANSRGRRPQTCRPQLCGRANPDSVIKARFELRWLCARTDVISSPLWGVSDVTLRAIWLRRGRVILSGVYNAPEAMSRT